MGATEQHDADIARLMSGHWTQPPEPKDRTAEVRRHGLDYVMDFDHAITVHPDGRITDCGRSVYAELCDRRLDVSEDGWDYFSRYYTSQDRPGDSPIMHDCESIGGRLERDILATPGDYMTVICEWMPNCDCDPHADDTCADCEDWDEIPYLEGWVVISKPLT